MRSFGVCQTSQRGACTLTEPPKRQRLQVVSARGVVVKAVRLSELVVSAAAVPSTPLRYEVKGVSGRSVKS